MCCTNFIEISDLNNFCHDARNIQLIAEVHTYGMTYKYTYRQTQLTFYMFVWGSLTLTPIK